MAMLVQWQMYSVFFERTFAHMSSARVLIRLQCNASENKITEKICIFQASFFTVDFFSLLLAFLFIRYA